jgi:tetratricopeptide (TPR) repeat protein
MPLENELLNQGLERLQAGDYEAALNLLDRAIAENPRQPDAWYQKGLVLQKLGRYVEAVVANQKFSALTRALKKVSKTQVKSKYSVLSMASQQSDSAERWYAQGTQEFQLGSFEDAIASFDKALKMKLDNHEVWHNRGTALGSLGCYEEAVASFDEALKHKPNFHEAWYNRGIALSKLKQYDKVIASYDKALKFKPDHIEAWYYRGVVLCDNLNRHEEAIACFDKVLELSPDYPQGWNRKGVVLCDHLNRYEEAIACFDKALELNLGFHQAYFNRGVALSQCQRHEAAIDSYDMALKLNPDDHKTWGNRGAALYFIKRYEDAIASFDKALDLKINDYQTWKNRGDSVLSSPVYSKFSALVVGSSLSQHSPQLNQRGYSGQVITLEFGLTQVAPHSEEWGYLQYALGEAHFNQSKLEQKLGHNPSPYWQKARDGLDLALSISSVEVFPKLRLETLQLMIRILLAQCNNATAQVRRKEAVELLHTLLNQAPTSFQKKPDRSRVLRS